MGSFATTTVRTTTNATAANVLWRARTKFGAPLNPIEEKFLEILKWRDSLPKATREMISEYFCALKEERKDPDNISGVADWAWDQLRDIHAYEAWFPYVGCYDDNEDYILQSLYRRAGKW